jgi:hypothetical protein
MPLLFYCYLLVFYTVSTMLYSQFLQVEVSLSSSIRVVGRGCIHAFKYCSVNLPQQEIPFLYLSFFKQDTTFK